jgi:hypothetical protein
LLAQEKWIAARAKRVLPVRHFHVVFTLPSELRSLARFRPKLVYAALFAAASATLVELGQSRLGAELGITMVLHTWTRDLRLHPHVHAIVTAGGLTNLGPPLVALRSNRYGEKVADASHPGTSWRMAAASPAQSRRTSQ